MRYFTLVSKQSGRLPLPLHVDACDDAEAAFLAAEWDRDSWPHVYPLGADKWAVSDGMQTTKVQILSVEEQS